MSESNEPQSNEPVDDGHHDDTQSGDSAPQDSAQVPNAPVDDDAVENGSVENGNHQADHDPANPDAPIGGAAYAPFPTGDGEIVEPVEMRPAPVPAPDISVDLQAIAAKGGAVGAVVLGVVTIAGSFVTNWSIINGILGLVMGLWGLTSRRRPLAWLGLGLCLIGSMLAILSIGDFISDWWTIRADEAP